MRFSYRFIGDAKNPSLKARRAHCFGSNSRRLLAATATPCQQTVLLGLLAAALPASQPLQLTIRLLGTRHQAAAAAAAATWRVH